MAYNKYTWVDGELITAEKLNHIEDGIAEGGEAGYECTEATEQLFSETVTTVQDGDDVAAQLAYSDQITADELIVVFNGTQYICPKITVAGADNFVFYGGMSDEGAPDFTNYPFVIVSNHIANVNVNVILTESSMNVTVSASVASSTVETTECFEKAVKSVVDRGYECNETITPLFEETVTTSGSSPSPMATLTSTERITADILTITFDGVEYDCPKQEMSGRCLYGASSPNDFSTYPFAFMSSEENMLYTQTAGEHTIAASTTVYTPENVSDCFKGAVGGVVSDYLAENFASHIHTETVQGEVSVRPDGVASGVDLACSHKPVGIIGIQPTAKNTMGVDGEVILKEMYMAGSYGNNLHLDYLNTTSEVQTFTVYVTYTYIGAGRDR